METKCIYVEHLVGVSKKSEKPYNMLKLSNGLDSKMFTCTLPESDTEQIEKGAEVTVKFEQNGDPFSYFGIQSVITEIND